jgi:hypothetical protein
MEPGDGSLRNTLGVAQYRAGQWQSALETLTESDRLQSAQLGGSHPADLAFLAMAHLQLGQKEKAQGVLGRLREALKQTRWSRDAEARGFLQEAEALAKTSQDDEQEKKQPSPLEAEVKGEANWLKFERSW